MLPRLLRALWFTGLWLKCPNCHQGNLFASFFKLHKTCPVCAVRFERETGEETGGMSVSIVVLGVVFLLCYPLTEIFTTWPAWVHLLIWLPFSIIFPILFYRYSRSLWIVFLYLTDGIKPDVTIYEDTTLTMIDAFRAPPNQEDYFEGGDGGGTPPSPPSK